MGSRHRHSNQPKKAGRAVSGKATSTPPRSRGRAATDFDALLGRFSDALSILATAAQALNGVLEHVCTDDPEHDVAAYVHTLEVGMRALLAVYNELDVGLREVRP